jgi:hypothetical protein
MAHALIFTSLKSGIPDSFGNSCLGISEDSHLSYRLVMVLLKPDFK